MSEQSYQASPTKRRRSTKAEVERHREALFEIVADMQPMTVRQVFYQASVRGVIEKTEAGYGKVQHDLVLMRRAGTLPYDWLTDATRWQRKPRTFTSIEEALTNVPPLPDSEVVKTVQSAWGYTGRGENRFGQTGAFYPTSEINHFVEGGRAMQDVFVLEAYLKANNRPDREFWVANGLANQLEWTLRRLQAARKRMIELGRVLQIRKPATGFPATYRWPSQGAQKCSPILN